jgi:uncharacterized protein
VGSLPEFWPDIEAFQWDDGNASKNWTRHQVSQTEAEQVFLNRPLVVVDAGRLLTVVFTVRDSRLRVISVRPMSRRERRGYGQASDN